jgi:predicted transcriptional regulator
MARVVAGPTELELLILKVLWKAGGPLIVRDVRERLADEEGRDLAHTTVVTTLHTMTDKKLVIRRQVNAKAYSFEARVEEGSVSLGMLEDLLTRVFDGSASALLVSLLDSGHVNEDEHRELRRLINRRRNQGDEA